MGRAVLHLLRDYECLSLRGNRLFFVDNSQPRTTPQSGYFNIVARCDFLLTLYSQREPFEGATTGQH